MRKQEESKQLHVIHELVAIILMGAGALVLLALISYEPDDVGFFSSSGGGEIDNFIGPIGATVATGLVLGFGVASYLIPLVMLVGGAMLLMPRQVHYWHKAGWFALLMLSGAGLLQCFGGVVRPIAGVDWPGGIIGYALHDRVLARLIGFAGSVIVLSIVYVSSLILLFEVRPVEFVIRCWKFINTWLAEREQRKFEEADPISQLEYRSKQLEKEQRKIQRTLEKKARKNSDIDDADASPALADWRRGEARGQNETGGRPSDKDSLPRRPEPQVIDSMAGPAPDDDVSIGNNDESEAGVEAIAEAPTAPSKPAGLKSPGNLAKSRSITITDAAPHFEDYRLPEVHLLNANEHKGSAGLDEQGLKAEQKLLIDTLLEFGIEVDPGNITKGATITRYEVYPRPGVRVERIAKMHKDIARALMAESVNILAPIPGKDTVGIEIGNADKSMIVLRDLFESDAWRRSKAKLPLALGKDVYGKTLIADLAEMPHLLIGGSTGSGKSVCINCILMSFLFKFTPEDLRIIMVDPKVVELQVYNDLPHLVVPVVTEPKKVLMALRWVINEMESRYRMMARCGVRNIGAFNQKQAEKRERVAAEQAARAAQEAAEEALAANGHTSGHPEDASNDDASGVGNALPGFESSSASDADLPDKLPYIVVIIDELADLMATTAAEVELAIARLSAKARAAGIHLIIATQTPRAQVVTGVIKTNVPCRIAFKVPSALDSRVILDENGAENLLGKGDMLYLPPGSSKQVRAQGAFVSDDEVAAVVDLIKSQTGPAFDQDMHQKLSKSASEDEELSDSDLENLQKALEVAMQERKLSTSLLQRRARIGYNTAARIIDFLEARGVLGAQEGAKPRELMVDPDDFDIDQFMDNL